MTEGGLWVQVQIHAAESYSSLIDFLDELESCLYIAATSEEIIKKKNEIF